MLPILIFEDKNNMTNLVIFGLTTAKLSNVKIIHQENLYLRGILAYQ